MSYLFRYLESYDNKTEEDLSHVMSALALMQQPTYFRMKPHVRKSQYLLPLLRDVNVTDFMLTVIPIAAFIMKIIIAII